MRPPPTPTLFVEGDGMRVSGLWFWESVNQSAGYNETSHLSYLCILGLLVPKCPLSISDQHSIVFTREYSVEKFIEEHLSSQMGLLLAPCAWCEITNISLKNCFAAPTESVGGYRGDAEIRICSTHFIKEGFFFFLLSFLLNLIIRV